MSTTVSEGGGGNFTPAPEGTHVARCVKIIDIGTQPGSEMYPEPRHKIILGWELPDEMMATDDGGERPHLVMQWYTASLHEKSKLRQHLHSWRGRAFTPEELRGFQLKNVLGVPCMLSVVHTEKGRAVVASVAKLPKAVHCAPAINPLVHYEIEHRDNDVFRGMSDKMQSIIRQAQEWDGPAADDDAHANGDDGIPF